MDRLTFTYEAPYWYWTNEGLQVPYSEQERDYLFYIAEGRKKSEAQVKALLTDKAVMKFFLEKVCREDVEHAILVAKKELLEQKEAKFKKAKEKLKKRIKK